MIRSVARKSGGVTRLMPSCAIGLHGVVTSQDTRIFAIHVPVCCSVQCVDAASLLCCVIGNTDRSTEWATGSLDLFLRA